MPNNMIGRGLTDREVLHLCIEIEKGRCMSIANTMMETSHEELRNIYQNCLENASSNQYSLYEMMKDKGWYQSLYASKEQIGEVQELMQNNLNPDSESYEL
ncbi:spore coat protein [Salipaludibacillus sp. CF4.18]|uniref:spore coat protein n=1 Tax=Salipaludibacillus sp. CF4.18 TaxID=3373081 RepID=UPI003EE5BCA3